MPPPEPPEPWWRDDGWRGLPRQSTDEYDPTHELPDPAELADIAREAKERDRK